MTLSDFLSFEWLEGSRTFAIVFGTVLSGACLSLGIPILRGMMPRTHMRLFPERSDPRQVLQILFGIFCMSMACANALCRYIPHRPLGFVHPAFFFTTLAIVVLLGPRVFSVWVLHRIPPLRVPAPAMATVLAAIVLVPISVVANAFWP